jgi:predicted molibdopterin-dependent oxidoreductase YjgC
MVKLKIDNTEYEVSDGVTILDAATTAGVDIPTICHHKGLPHYSSCMVCMVRDKKTGNFIPSCSAQVQNDMDIDCSSGEVLFIRKKAVELLLSEHRAECEAPCKLVCPGGYNIPLMNRLISSNDFECAVKLSLSYLQSSELKCTDCTGYCENACRRKKIDTPVSIRNLQLYIFQKTRQERSIINIGTVQNDTSSPVPERKSERSSRRFSSHIGKIEISELTEWLKECTKDSERRRDINDSESAVSEASNCMHCDCRAAENCKLRDIADKLSIKDPRGKLINSRIEKKINIHTGLIFENAKCIKCGLCVRLCENSDNEPALCFINRGFVSIISEPLTMDFNDILKSKSKEVIEICPTGALNRF